MSWQQSLYETYEKNCGKKHFDVIPLFHCEVESSIHIVVNEDGNFLRASLDKQRIIIPVTESSAGRSGAKISPHPLFDNLKYIAGDYREKINESNNRYDVYIEQLMGWIDSEYSHEKIKSVFIYLKKQSVLSDLVAVGLCTFTYEDQIILSPDLSNALVRFSVEKFGDEKSELWDGQEIRNKWRDYHISITEKNENEKRICFFCGKKEIPTEINPKYLRFPGDGAKLISWNDKNDFTFRGRLSDQKDIVSVGANCTLKIHDTLRWLIKNQSQKLGDMRIISWCTSAVELPDVGADSFDLLNLSENEVVYTGEDVSSRLSQLLKGYSTKLENTDNIHVAVFDSTNGEKGRLSIRYYNELKLSDFLMKIENWHSECCWHQMFSKEKEFYGAPSPKEIVLASYGKNAPERLVNSDILDLTLGIINGKNMSNKIEKRLFNRLVKREGMNIFEWRKCLGIFCSVYRKNHKEEKYAMALEETKKSRDYLYGRLLALYEIIEYLATGVRGRETNAERLTSPFSRRPNYVFKRLHEKTMHYRSKLKKNNIGTMMKIDAEIESIMSMFENDDFNSDSPLSGEFIMGYFCQKDKFFSKKEKENENE